MDPETSSGWQYSVRIDRFLFFIRLAKSRTLAQSIVDEGYVRIDGKRVEKPSEEVREGSVVALPLHGAVRIVRVLEPHPPRPRRAAVETTSRTAVESSLSFRQLTGAPRELTSRNPRPSEAREGAAHQ